MKNKKWNDIANLSLGFLFISLGVSVLISGKIKSMTLGDERIIPAAAALGIGGWILISYTLRILKSHRRKK